jgi:cyclophilin family peptidyl-prolyl cis-trans isomerase
MVLRFCTPAVILVVLAMLASFGCSRSDNSAQPAAIPSAADEKAATNVKPTANEGAIVQKPAPDARHPVILLNTTLGDVKIRLDADKSPLTVSNFLSYVMDGHYNDTIIHQIYKDQGILAGGYDAKLVERACRTPIYNEARNGLKNRRGTVAMVRQPNSIHSATSQFFINVADNPSLDYRDNTPEGYGYCVFGEVIEGINVVDKMNASPLHDVNKFERTPVEPIVIKSAQRVL